MQESQSIGFQKESPFVSAIQTTEEILCLERLTVVDPTFIRGEDKALVADLRQFRTTTRIRVELFVSYFKKKHTFERDFLAVFLA